MFIVIMSADSVTTDSTLTDTTIVYEVPEIISLQVDDFLKSSITYEKIYPSGHEMVLTDVFYLTPFMLTIYGTGQIQTISQKGYYPSNTTIFLNGHKVYNPLFGYFNLTLLPVQFFESISINGDILPSPSNNINIASKVNHYDRPFSRMNYSTGDYGFNVYNIDFSRPITNDFGLYLGGLYQTYGGYRENSNFEITSFYTNFYYNQFIPMRIDFVYFTNEYGIPGSMLDTLPGNEYDKFVDICFVCGSRNHKIAMYYTLINNDYTDVTSNETIKSSIKNIGISTKNYYAFNNFQLSYGLIGETSRITADIYGSHVINTLVLWADAKKNLKKMFINLSNYGELVNTYHLFYVPKITLGFDVFDSTYIYGTVTRGFRMPSITETHESSKVSPPFYKMKGNKDLLPEYYWEQEFGIKRKNFVLSFYKHDFTNRIITQLDSEGYCIPTNRTPWHTMGIMGSVVLPLYVHYSGDGKSTTEFATGFSGNYLLKGDSLPLMPKGNSSFFITFKRETEKFGFDLILKERFIDTRYDVFGNETGPARIISVAGTIRFITLSCILSIDNIRDETYAYIPHYPMSPRTFDVSLRWEFWD